MPPLTRLCLALCTLLLLLVAAPAAPADHDEREDRDERQQSERPSPSTSRSLTPLDYTKVKGLSTARYETEREVIRLPAFDGRELYLEVVKPKKAGRWPVILESSPYHGTLADRDGTRILPVPRDEDGRSLGLTGYFAPRGYAVVMHDLRGTGRSQGCLDHLGQKDARDLEQVVEWAASRSWSNGRVGMTGHSYVGSTPSVAAAQNPTGLKTIVPSAGLASMYDHQFQAGVPYFLQWAGPIEAYEQLAIERKLPAFADPFGLTHTGDDFGNSMEETGCGLPNSAAVAGEDQLSGRYSSWHETRDHSEGAKEADIPVFAVHGVNDNAARVSALEWFNQRDDSRDKLWLGQWDHGSGCCPTRRGIQWTKALHAWFDRHLARRPVSTGPPVEAFLSDGTFAEARAGDREQILTRSRWAGRGDRTLTFHPAADGTLGTAAPAQAGSKSFAGDPRGFSRPQGTGGATFSTAPMPRDLVLAGVPTMRLAASVTAPRVHLIANLFDESPTGDRRRITQFAINPELRDGIARRSTVTPGQRYDMTPPGYAMAHNLRAGHKLVLRVTASDPDKVPAFAVDPNITVFTGPGATSVTVPVVDRPRLTADTVPLEEATATPAGPAQAPVEGKVTTSAPGLGLARPAGSAFFEFTVGQGDNAKMTALATPSTPADVDLYLQRKAGDGWSRDLASGASGDVDKETLTSGRLAPGTYRIEVHNYAGQPGNEVALRLEFANTAGEVGR